MSIKREVRRVPDNEFLTLFGPQTGQVPLTPAALYPARRGAAGGTIGAGAPAGAGRKRRVDVTRISLDEVDVQLDTVHVATIADLAGDRPGDVTRSAPEVDDDVRSSPSSWPPSG